MNNWTSSIVVIFFYYYYMRDASCTFVFMQDPLWAYAYQHSTAAEVALLFGRKFGNIMAHLLMLVSRQLFGPSLHWTVLVIRLKYHHHQHVYLLTVLPAVWSDDMLQWMQGRTEDTAQWLLMEWKTFKVQIFRKKFRYFQKCLTQNFWSFIQQKSSIVSVKSWGLLLRHIPAKTSMNNYQ